LRGDRGARARHRRLRVIALERRLNPPGRSRGFPSQRALRQLVALQASVQALSAPRNVALRLFLASRHATTVFAQREFWLEFAWRDQEYRAAVRRLTEFCLQYRGLVASQ
jgi:hypothetical protein